MMRWVACVIIRASCATSHLLWSCACALATSIVLAKARIAARFCPNSSCNSRASTRRSSLRISNRRLVSAARSSMACASRSPRSLTACPIMASSIDRKRGSELRYWPRAMRCRAATICCAGASVCAIASDASSAIATAINRARWMLSRMCCQASAMAAFGSGVAETLPALAARALIGRTTGA